MPRPRSQRPRRMLLKPEGSGLQSHPSPPDRSLLHTQRGVAWPSTHALTPLREVSRWLGTGLWAGKGQASDVSPWLWP